MPASKMQFNESNNHNIGAGYIFQWWLAAMFHFLISDKYFPVAAKIKLKKLQHLRTIWSGIKITHPKEYAYAKAVLTLHKEIDPDGESFTFVEWEDYHLEDINILTSPSKGRAHQIMLIQSKTAAEWKLTKGTLLSALVKFSKNKNLDECLKKYWHWKPYIPRTEIWKIIKFYIITNWGTSSDAESISKALWNRKKIEVNELAGLVEDLFKKIFNIPTNTRKNGPKNIASWRLTPFIKPIIQSIHKQQWGEAQDGWNSLTYAAHTMTNGDFWPHNLDYWTMLKVITVLENTVIIPGLNFFHLKTEMLRAAEGPWKAAKIFYKIAEASVSNDEASPKQAKHAKKFSSVKFSEGELPGVLKKQGKFII